MDVNEVRVAINPFVDIREHLQLPAYKISQGVGRGRGAYSDWERGVSGFRFDVLVKFQEVYNISPDFILYHKGDMITLGDYSYDFPKRLKKERLDRGLSQKAFATQLDVSRQYYNYIETGRMEPSIEFVMSLKELTDKPILYYVGGQYCKVS